MKKRYFLDYNKVIHTDYSNDIDDPIFMTDTSIYFKIKYIIFNEQFKLHNQIDPLILTNTLSINSLLKSVDVNKNTLDDKLQQIKIFEAKNRQFKLNKI